MNDAVQRISYINWGSVGLVERKSNVALAKEYLRRAALLVKTYSLDTRFPFFSAARAVGKSPHIDMLKICPQIEEIKSIILELKQCLHLKYSISFN